MKRFAVIGHPIGHSLSPLMHNTAFKLLGMNYEYEMLDIEPEKLKESIGRFKREEWGGFNVTVPHKESIMPLLDEIDAVALEIGAVNTVVKRNEKLTGYNTDIVGVENALMPARSEIVEKPCVIIGSGGAARSVTHVLIHKFRVKSITFVALYPEQAYSLIKSLGKDKVDFRVVPSNDKEIEIAVRSCKLIVNATAIGMYPNNLETPISNRNWISGDHIVFDVIYRPLRTRLLDEAGNAGAVAIGGLNMFIHQGAAAFRLWTDREMPLDDIRRVLEEKLAS